MVNLQCAQCDRREAFGSDGEAIGVGWHEVILTMTGAPNRRHWFCPVETRATVESRVQEWMATRPIGVEYVGRIF